MAGCAPQGFDAERIADELQSGLLRPLPLRSGGERKAPLYLTLADPDFAGPGVRRLAQIVRDVAQNCLLST